MKTASIVVLALVLCGLLYLQFVKKISGIKVIKTSTDELPPEMLGKPVVSIVQKDDGTFLVQNMDEDVLFGYICQDAKMEARILVSILMNIPSDKREMFVREVLASTNKLEELEKLKSKIEK